MSCEFYKSFATSGLQGWRQQEPRIHSELCGLKTCFAAGTVTVPSNFSEGFFNRVGSWQLLISSGEEEAVTMANKRAQIQKLSDASLGKFDADQSRVAYLDTWMNFKVCKIVTSGSVGGCYVKKRSNCRKEILVA